MHIVLEHISLVYGFGIYLTKKTHMFDTIDLLLEIKDFTRLKIG